MLGMVWRGCPSGGGGHKWCGARWVGEGIERGWLREGQIWEFSFSKNPSWNENISGKRILQQLLFGLNRLELGMFELASREHFEGPQAIFSPGAMGASNNGVCLWDRSRRPRIRLYPPCSICCSAPLCCAKWPVARACSWH